MSTAFRLLFGVTSLGRVRASMLCLWSRRRYAIRFDGPGTTMNPSVRSCASQDLISEWGNAPPFGYPLPWPLTHYLLLASPPSSLYCEESHPSPESQPFSKPTTLLPSQNAHKPSNPVCFPRRYKSLLRTGNRPLAERTFERNRSFYHPICRGMVEKLLRARQ